MEGARGPGNEKSRPAGGERPRKGLQRGPRPVWDGGRDGGRLPMWDVRSVQIRISGEVDPRSVIEGLERVAREHGFEKRLEEPECERGTFVEFKGEERPVLKAWRVHDRLTIVHARDAIVDTIEAACRVASEGGAEAEVAFDVELNGRKRDLDRLVKSFTKLGFTVERDHVTKGGREYLLLLIKLGDRVIAKIYVRAPRKELAGVGGSDGAWGAESVVRVRRSAGGSWSPVTYGGPGPCPKWILKAEQVGRRLARRLLRQGRAREFLRRYYGPYWIYEVLSWLGVRDGSLVTPDLGFWMVALEEAARVIRKRIRRHRRRRSRNVRRLDEYRGAGGPPS